VPSSAHGVGGSAALASWEIRLSKVLVVTGSVVLAEMLERILGCHSERVLTAASLEGALKRIAQHADVDLVISDVTLPDGDGLRLLDHVRRLESPKPRVILLSGRRVAGESERAFALGAIGYLMKPICFRDVAGVLRQAVGPLGVRSARRRSSAQACLLDPPRKGGSGSERSQLFWYVRDLSATGAFLETESPIPVGTRFDLSLDLDGLEARVTAEVVRVQEPGWGRTGGVGVRFVAFGQEARERLREHVAGADDRSF
jgi:CheY-like chemotaxis protein